MKTIELKPDAELANAWLQLSDSVVTEYFEKARLEYLSDLASRLAPRTSAWVQASLHLDYLGSYLGEHPARVDISVTEVGQSSFTLSCRIYQLDQLRVTGNCVLVNIDRKTGRPVALCSQTRQMLNQEVLSFYRMQKPAANGAAANNG